MLIDGYHGNQKATDDADARRLLLRRRSRLARRRRLLLPGRPQDGHGDLRRREHLPAGDRGAPARASGGARGRGDRRARSRVGRDAGAFVVLRDGQRRRRASELGDWVQGGARRLQAAAQGTCSSTRCRATRRARCSSASSSSGCRRRSRRAREARARLVAAALWRARRRWRRGRRATITSPTARRSTSRRGRWRWWARCSASGIDQLPAVQRLRRQLGGIDPFNPAILAAPGIDVAAPLVIVAVRAGGAGPACTRASRRRCAIRPRSPRSSSAVSASGQVQAAAGRRGSPLGKQGVVATAQLVARRRGRRARARVGRRARPGATASDGKKAPAAGGAGAPLRADAGARVRRRARRAAAVRARGGGGGLRRRAASSARCLQAMHGGRCARRADGRRRRRRRRSRRKQKARDEDVRACGRARRRRSTTAAWRSRPRPRRSSLTLAWGTQAGAPLGGLKLHPVDDAGFDVDLARPRRDRGDRALRGQPGAVHGAQRTRRRSRRWTRSTAASTAASYAGGRDCSCARGRWSSPRPRRPSRSRPEPDDGDASSRA